MGDDLKYHDMSSTPKRRGAKRRAKTPLPDFEAMGIGTRTCFAFRPPRTITTSEMSVEELSHSQPYDEKLGLLQEPADVRSWTHSLSETTAALTSRHSTPVSSPELSDGFASSNGDSLLAMPTPSDRSHQKRLQMERGGGGNTYDGEQEPAGYRGQEATPGRAPVNNLLGMPTPTDRSHRRRLQMEGDGKINRYDGEQEPAQFLRQEGISTPQTTSPAPPSLLAMPTPKDRSHRKRLEMERAGNGNTYKGEQEPMGFRGQESSTPQTISPEQSNNLLAMSPPTSRSHRREQMERERSNNNTYKEEQDPVGHLFAESDKILDNGVRASTSRRRSKRQSPAIVEEEHARGEAPTGSPYLQFSTDGPALRVFEKSQKRLQLMVSPNSSMGISENASIESEEHVRLMVSDLVPLSASTEKKCIARVAGDEQQKKMQPAKTPTQSRGYGTDTTHASSARTTPERPTRAVTGGSPTVRQHDSKWLTPERSALAVIRNGSQDSGDYSSSTHSSENLRSMMTDLLVEAHEDQSTATSQTSKFGTLPDVNEMAMAAQSHVEQGEYDLALVLFGRILAIYRKKYGDLHPLVASAYHNLGMVHSQRASILLEGTLQQTHVRQQSLECFQAAARTARDSLGKSHPNVAVSLVKIGFLLLQARQHKPALVTFEEALRIRTVYYVNNPQHPLIANLHNNIGVANLHLQNFRESKQSLSRALDIQRHNLRVKRMKCTREELRVRLLEVADTLANLGGLGLEWLRQEAPQEKVMREAEGHLTEALEIRSALLGQNHPLVIQVKSLHDMVRSTSSLVRARKTPHFTSSSKPLLSRMSSPNTQRGSAIRAAKDVVNLEALNMSRIAPTCQVLALPSSPIKSPNTSRDAPAPKAYSPSLGLELASRDAKTPSSSPKPQSPSPRRTSFSSESAARGRTVNGTPPVSEIVKGKEADSLDDPPYRRRSQTPERTKIFVKPHYIPRQSPTRKSLAKDESYYPNPKTPILASSSGSESSVDHQPRIHAYDTEESCLINESGDRVDLLSPFLVQRGEDDENEVNLLSHEIMVVRPSASAMARDTPGPLVQPLAHTIKGRWKGDPKRKTSGGGKELDESDNGIAPLCRSQEMKSDQKVLLSEEMLEKPEPHLADIHAAASRYLKKNRLLEAKHLFSTVLDCQRNTHGELHEDVGAALHNVGLVHLRLNEHAQALDYFERAVRVRKGSLGREHPEVALSQVKVGISLLLMHNFDMALHAFLEALSIRKRALGALHPSLARVYNNIACVHVEFNELREARRAFEAALDIQRNALCHEPDSGPLMFGAATTLCNLGYLYRYREMHEKAALVLKEALSLQESVLETTHPTVVATMDSLADALSLSGGCSHALQYYSEILSRLEYIEDMSNRRQAEAVILYKMSRAHRKQNDIEAELDKLQMALRAIRATSVKTASEKRRKEELERHIMTDIRGSQEELKKMQLDWI